MFPSIVHDPIMVLVYFRQNISGSTYFHILHESAVNGDIENFSTSEGYLAEILQGDNSHDNHTMTTNICFNPREFTLFYNASPSQLDPNFQNVSTLTDIGKKYSRESGFGIALIELRLLQADNTLVDTIPIGSMSPLNIRYPIPGNFLRLENISNFKITNKGCSMAGNDKCMFRISVRIVNTTLKTDILHKWIDGACFDE